MNQLPNNLIDSLRAGDEDGYRQLFTLYYEQLYVQAYGILQNHADAEDAVQRTFIRVYQKLPTLKNDGRFSVWVSKVANNEALMILRSRKPTTQLDEETEELVADRDLQELMLPEAALERSDTAEQLRQMIARLPLEQRRTLILHYYQGLKVAEIAEIMDCSVSTVKSRLRYARLRIKKEWDEYEHRERKKLNGVMLPFGEVFVRLLRKDAQSKRRRRAVWKHIKAFLRHKDEPEYAVVARAENIHALRVAAGIAAGFVAVMLASATMVGAAADGDEPGSAYGFGEQAEYEKEKLSNTRETVYIPPQDIVEQRIDDVPNGAVDDVVYDYEMDTVPENEDEGLNDQLENGQVAATETATEPATEPPTQPPTQPPTEPPTQPTAPPATEPTVLERLLSLISGRYEGDIAVSGDTLYANDLVEDQPLDPVRVTSAELLDNGTYRFVLAANDRFAEQYGSYGYYYPAGTSLSAFPSELAEQMRYRGYRSYGVSYSDGAYRLQKDALLFTELSQYGWTYYGHHLRAE